MAAGGIIKKNKAYNIEAASHRLVKVAEYE